MPPKGLSFDRAEYGPQNVFQTFCTWCSRGVAGEFFRANGDPICAVCAERARNVLPKDTREVFWRTTGVGLVVAVGASIGYLQLIRVLRQFGSGYGMAFGAIAVGYVIGRGMHAASKGAGGRRYQVAAALLTYAAIAVPLAVNLLGTDGMPGWAYPFLVLVPVASMVFGQVQMGLLELMMAGIGVQWAWQLLRAPGLKITGPESTESSPASV
jgi:hypothetical protein